MEELSYLLGDLFCTNSHSPSQFYCLLQRQFPVYGRVVLSTRRSVLYQFTLPVTILLSITDPMSCLWKSCLIYWKICSVPVDIPYHNSVVYFRDNILSMEDLFYLLEHLFCTNSHSLSQFCCLLQRQCPVYGNFWSTRKFVLYQFTFPVIILLSIIETMSCLWKSCFIY